MLLDQMRRHSRSFIIYIFFGIIIAVFVVNFGPQSAGCGAGTTYAGDIAGGPMTLTDFNYAMSVSGLRGRAVDEAQMAQLKGYVVDQFIVRELLAREAERRGMSIGDKAINDMLVKGRYLALGIPRSLIRGKDDSFDYDLFSRYVRYNWGITVKKFKLQQRREMLAERFKQIIRSATQISEAEVLADFDHKSSRTKLEYVRFAPTEFRDKVVLSQAKVDAFIQAKATEIKKHYESNKTAYTKLPKQVQLRVIKIAFADDVAKPDAKKTVDALQARITGGEAFAKVAAETSEDASKAGGGLLEWRNAKKPGLGEAIKKALATLKDGMVSPVIEDAKHFWLIKLEGHRKGDLTLKQASPEIARQMLRDDEAKKLALATAKTFITRAKAGEKLTTMFSTEDDDKDGAKDDIKKSPLKLRSTAFFPRSAHNLVPGIGISGELMKAAFTLEAGTVADEPFTVGSMIYLLAVKERQSPDLNIWAKRKDDFVEQFQGRKGDMAVRDYAYQLCRQAYENGELRVHASVMAAPTQPGVKPKKRKLPVYTPCKTLNPNALPVGRF
ncbi:MAG: SurA N-terminal domain-containing protein [Deltaproteobacteria bacterium]|nr:SurA N-terminal domain-containing protein [Deltaproteobacteria bacterium]